MAKLSIAGPSFEGNAARKMPLHEVEKDEDDEEMDRETLRPEPMEPEPITQRSPRRIAEEKAEDEARVAKLQQMIGEQSEVEKAKNRIEPDGELHSSISKALAKQREKSLEKERQLAKEEISGRLRPKMDAMRAKQSQQIQEAQETSARIRTKMKETRANLGLKQIDEDAAYSIKPPAELMEAGSEFMEAMKMRKKVSLEEANQLLPHGDRVLELVSTQLGMDKEKPSIKDTFNKFSITMEVSNDPMDFGKRYDAATEYVRTLAKYRRAVANGDAPLRAHALNQIIGFNRAMNIPANAEIEANLEQEDVDTIHTQLNQEYVADKLEKASQEKPKVPLSVEALQENKLVDNPHDLWNELVEEDARIPRQKANLITEYIVSIGRINKAARDKNYNAYMSEKARVDRMSSALGLEDDSRITDRIELAPVKNPFEGNE